MANVNGLRPTDTNKSQGSQKSGRVTTRRTTQQSVGVAPSAAPVDRFKGAPAAADDRRLAQIADALGSLNPAIAKLGSTLHANKEKDQMEKLRFYTEQFMQDKESGAITSAQVKEKLPELVPTVAARIAQATGSIEAKNWLQGEVQTILQDDNLRLNSVARNAAIADIRTRANEQIGSNEFYGNGFLEQLDSTLNQFETRWMQETAAHHEDIQKEGLSLKVADAIQQGVDLDQIDQVWKNSSSLSNHERNAVVVETFIGQAIASSNPKLLEQVPQRFLNAQSKVALEKTKLQIETSMYSQFVRGKELNEYERNMSIRTGKSEILHQLVQGAPVTPAEYANTPELYEYAVRMNAQPSVDGTISKRNASAFRSNLLKAGTSGSFGEAFEGDAEFAGSFHSEGAVTEEALRDHILSRSDLNPTEKQQLFDDVPKLLEGVNFMRDPDVTDYFRSTVGQDLDIWARGALGQAGQALGLNIQGDVQMLFHKELQMDFNAYMEDHGEIPKGREKLRMVKEAAAAAKNHMKELQQNWNTLLNEQGQSLKGNPSSTNRAPVTPQRGLPPGVKRIE